MGVLGRLGSDPCLHDHVGLVKDRSISHIIFDTWTNALEFALKQDIRLYKTITKQSTSALKNP